MWLLDRLSYSIKKFANTGVFLHRPLFVAVIAALLIVLLSGCSPELPAVASKIPVSASTAAVNKTQTPVKIQSSVEATTTAATGKTTVKSPEALPLKVKASLSSRGVSLSIEAMIRNPNPEKVTIDDFKVSILNAAGSNGTHDNFTGGDIEAISSKLFTFNIEMPGQFLSERILNLEVATQAKTSATTFPVKAIMPINVADTLERLIIHPTINLQPSISKISYYPGLAKVEVQMEGSISNLNPIDLNFTSLVLMINNKNDVPTRDSPLSSAAVPGASIPAMSGYPFKTTLYLPLEVLNQTGLKAYAYTSVHYLNYVQSINNTVSLAVPKVGSLLTVPQLTVNVKSGWNENVVNRFYVVTVIAEIKNENEFSFTDGDFKLNLYNNTTGALLKTATTSIDMIKGSSSRSVLNTTFDFTPQEMGRLGFDLALAGNINLGLQGLNEKIPVSTRTVSTLVP